MGTDTVPPDGALDREFAELRARAYGVDADIDDDPRAAARLAELEAWHVADGLAARAGLVESPGPVAAVDSPTSDMRVDSPPLRDSTPRPARRPVRAFVAGAAAASAVALVVASWFALQAPQPDAVLRETSGPSTEQVRRLAGYARVLLIDESSLRGHGSYLGVELWTATSALGNRCLLALEPSTDSFLGADCVPYDADPTIAIYDVPIRSLDEWHDRLPRGTVVRFVLSDDVVRVWVHEGSRGG